jgi:hypothetical protein
MTNRRSSPRRQQFEEPLSDATMDRAYGQRGRSGAVSLKITIAVISFIGALVFQGGTFVWWCSQQSSRLTAVETTQAAMQIDLRADQTSRNDMNTHLASIEQNIKDLRDMWFNRPAPQPQQIYVPTTPQAPAQVIMQAPAPVDGNKQSVPRE